MRIITNTRIQEFKLHLIDEERSGATVEKYMRDLRFFIYGLEMQKFQKAWF